MQFDLESSLIKIDDRVINIPSEVIEALKDEYDFTDESAAVRNAFLKTLDLKRIGYNGIVAGSYNEFIFKVEGDKQLDSHTEKHEIITTIGSVPVRIGSISDFAIFVIGCRNPLTKSLYANNDMFHYMSISFSCTNSEIGQTLQYSRSLVNKILSKGNSYISADDVFKPAGLNDDLIEDDYFNQPSL